MTPERLIELKTVAVISSYLSLGEQRELIVEVERLQTENAAMRPIVEGIAKEKEYDMGSVMDNDEWCGICGCDARGLPHDTGCLKLAAKKFVEGLK